MKIERKQSELPPAGMTSAPGAGGAARQWPLRAAWLLWIMLACAVSVKAVLVPVKHSVYPCFEAGGRAWLAGIELYPFCCEHEFRYGPVCAMALAPLARLPSAWGGLLWIWLDLGVFFLALQALMKRILPGPWTPGRASVFLCLVWLGIVRSIWSGQSNLLIVGLVALGVVAMAHKRWWLAALMLAIPVHIKVWPLAATGLLVACRPRQLAVRSAVCLLGVGALPLLTKPYDWVWRQYCGWYGALVGRAELRHEYRDAWTIWEAFHSPAKAHVPVTVDHPHVYLAVQLAAGGWCWGFACGRPGAGSRWRGCCCSCW